MKEEHFVGKVAQKAVIYREGQVLLVKDPRTKNFWELPGGRLNIDEEPKQGIIRELKEELGVLCNIEEVFYLTQFWQGTESAKRALVLVYRATMSKDAVLAVDPREVTEFGWFSKEEVLKLKIFPEHKKALELHYNS